MFTLMLAWLLLRLLFSGELTVHGTTVDNAGCWFAGSHFGSLQVRRVRGSCSSCNSACLRTGERYNLVLCSGESRICLASKPLSGKYDVSLLQVGYRCANYTW